MNTVYIYVPLTLSRLHRESKFLDDSSILLLLGNGCQAVTTVPDEELTINRAS